MKMPFIVLEGLSGSGKTTISELLAKNLNAVFFKTPGGLFSSVRDSVDKIADPTARFLFYLAGLVQSSVEIMHLCESKTVICDRYVHSTFCFHGAIGVPVNIISGHFNDLLVKPDFQFLITCKDEIRIARLTRRGLSHNDIVERNNGVEDRFMAEYHKRNMIEIDNSSDDPHNAVNEILSIIRN